MNIDAVQPAGGPAVRRPKSADLIKRACALYEQGMSIRGIEAALGRRPGTVRKWLVKEGVRMRLPGGNHGAPPRDLGPLVAPVRRMYLDEGLRIEEIAERTGEPYGLVRRVLRRAGIELRPGEHQPAQVSPDLAARIAALYTDEKLSMSKIARLLDTNTHVVRSALAQAKVTTPPARPQPRYPDGAPTDLDLELARLYRAGLSTRQICDKTGKGTRAVNNALKRAGVTKRPPGNQGLSGGAPSDLDLQLGRLYRAGMSVRGISKQTGNTVRVVNRALERAGVTKRPAVAAR